MIRRIFPAFLRRLGVIHRLGALLVIGFVHTGCLFESTDTAGTNDETTTSLQTLADNVREMPPLETGFASGSAAAGRLAGRREVEFPKAMNWRFRDYVDHGTWSSWRAMSNTACTPIDGDGTRCAGRLFEHLNDAIGFSETEGTFQYGQNGLLAVDRNMTMHNRSGFVWRLRHQIDYRRNLEQIVGSSRVVQFDFPSLGLHVDYQGEESEAAGTSALLDSMLAGLPLRSENDRVVGFLSIDTTARGGNIGLRWLDLDHREVVPRAQPFTPNGHDSLGVTVFSAHDDQERSEVVVEGRFHLSPEYGTYSTEMIATLAHDSSDAANGYPLLLAAPRGRFTLHIPYGAGRTPEAAPRWMCLVFVPRNVADSLPNGRGFQSRVFPVP